MDSTKAFLAAVAVATAAADAAAADAAATVAAYDAILAGCRAFPGKSYDFGYSITLARLAARDVPTYAAAAQRAARRAASAPTHLLARRAARAARKMALQASACANIAQHTLREVCAA